MAVRPDLGDVLATVEAVRAHVYGRGQPTPLQRAPLDDRATLLLKREDLSPIHAYKWRGACAKLGTLRERGTRKVVAASAGNHAQGVAFAAAHLGLDAELFMPAGAPSVKRRAVTRLGGDRVTVRLVDGSFDDAADAALAAVTPDVPLVHPFDDLDVIGGQGTIGVEIVESGTAPDHVFIPIGGGGLGAGIGAVLRSRMPDVRIVGVEALGQDAMSQARRAGRPVTLTRVDAFCDGTAVRRVGDLTYRLCAETLDDVVCVSNADVRSAIEWSWDSCRLLPEPSGALAIAAARAAAARGTTRAPLAIVSGANVDLSVVAGAVSPPSGAARAAVPPRR